MLANTCRIAWGQPLIANHYSKVCKFEMVGPIFSTSCSNEKEVDNYG